MLLLWSKAKSRAFVNESDDFEDFPDRLVSDHPNYVTIEGLALIDSTITVLRAKFAGAQLEGDRNALASVARDLRYWDARRTTAEVVPSPTDSSTVRFGSVVSIERSGRRLAYRIVGEDEADPNKGLLSHVSPALLSVFFTSIRFFSGGLARVSDNMLKAFIGESLIDPEFSN